MIGNEVCDGECDNEACEWDKLDCGCAPGCDFSDIESCKKECLVADCYYGDFPGYPACSSEIMRVAGKYYQIMQIPILRKFTSRPFDLVSDCLSFTSLCTKELWMQSFKECKADSECYYSECLWSFKHCHSVANCEAAYETVSHGSLISLCFECTPPFLNDLGYCVESCSEGMVLHPTVPRLCVLEEDLTSEDNPQLVFISPAYMGVDADGSLARPYASLAEGLQHTLKQYTKLLLIGQTHILSATHESKLLAYEIHENDWYNIRNQQIVVWIDSYDCYRHPGDLCERATVLIDPDLPPTLFAPAHYRSGFKVPACPDSLHISNINFHGMNSLFYGNFLISVRYSSASLRNVSFLNIVGLDGIISFKKDGSVVLANVDWTDVECRLACIWQDNNSDQICSFVGYEWQRVLPSFEFITGKVSLASTLFQSTRMDTVAFSNITFSRNILRSSGASILMLGTNVVFTLENCTFEDNLLHDGSMLFINADEFIFSAFQFPNKRYFNAPNIIIRNVNFSRNLLTANTELRICILTIPQRVLIDNCRFEDEYAARLISITSSAGVTKLGIFGPGYYPSIDMLVVRTELTRYKISHGVKRIEFPPVFVRIWNVNVINSTAGKDGLFFVANSTFLSVDNITLRNAKTSHCFPLFKLDSCYDVALTHLLIEDVICELGIAALQVTNSISALTISNSTLRRVKSAIALSVENSETVLVSNVSIHDCTAAERLVHFAGKVMLIEMTHLSLMRDSASSSVLHLDQVLTASITSSEFSSNKAYLGGAVLVTATDQMSLRIISTLFTDNSASAKGGAIHIEFTAPESRLWLSIADCRFEGNQAVIGAGLSVASEIELLPGSSVSNTVFVGHSADSEGAVSLHYSPGSLQFANCTFADNRGGDEAAILADYVSVQGKPPATLELSSVTFRNNSGSYVLRAPNSSLFVRMLAYNLLFADNFGVCLHLQRIGLHASLARFERNKADSGAAITLVSSYAFLSVSSFTENGADSFGGAVFLTESSQFDCNFCNFTSNSAEKQGGAIKVEKNSLLAISVTQFKGNKARQEGSAIHFLLTTANSMATNCEFAGNLAGADGTIVLSFSSFQMTRCLVKENISRKTTPGVLVVMSNLTIDDSVFENQSGSSGVYLYATSLSVMHINSSTFSNTTGSNYGAFYVEESSLLVTNSDFRSLSASQGSLAYVFNRAKFALQYCVVSQQSNRAMGAITTRLASVSVSGCQFSNYTNSSLWGQASSLLVTSSEFRGKWHVEGTGGEGVGLFCVKCVRVIVGTSNFTSLIGTVGGAISLSGREEDATVYMVASCVFVNNTANRGGAVAVNNVWLRLTASRFVDNSAEECGGAVAFSCDSPDKNCSSLVEYNTFQRNKAGLKGGAIAWGDISPTLSHSGFDSNTAPYGNSISSFATHLSALNSSLFSVASGQTVSQFLVLLLQDHYNQIVSIDNSTKAEIIPVVGCQCLVYGTTEVVADIGVFKFDAFIVSAQPGSTIQVQIRLVGEKAGIVMNVSMRLCEIGESLTDGRCLVCEAGKYSFDPNQPCQDCPGAAICKGNFTVVPRPGYWRANYLSKTFYECPNPQSCLGAPALTGTCAEGYRGNKCQVCARNFFRVAKLSCSQCASHESSIAKTAGLAVVMVIFATILVVTSMKSAYKAKSLHSVYLKILMNYFQLVMLMGTFNLNWPGLTKQLLDLQDSAGGFAEILCSSACLQEGYDESEEFYSKAVLMSLVPLIAVGASSFVWLCVAVYRKRVSTLKNELVGSAVILFLLVHPSVIRSMFALFNCEEIDSEYWLVGLDIRCWEESHWKYALGLALPSIIVWGVGIPSLALIVLIVYNKDLPQLDVKIRFGYLYNGYASEKYYWEFIVIYRKLLIISIALFLSRVSHLLQALLAFAILMLSLFLHQRSGAYALVELNEAEHRSLLVSTVTLFVGLFYLEGTMSPVLEHVFFAVIIAINVYFLQYWTRKSAKSWMLLLTSKVKCVRRCLVFVGDYSLAEIRRVDTRAQALLNSLAAGYTPMTPFMRKTYISKLQKGKMQSVGIMSPHEIGARFSS